MNVRLFSGLAIAPAVVLAAGLFAAAPASAQTMCNPVIDANTSPVVSANGTYVIHNGSYPCPPTAAAAPVVPATPGLQSEYLVFFDWDRSDITSAADRIISDVVGAIGSGRAAQARVAVIGHTDTSGSPAYNQRLSVRRAQAVKNALVAKGIPAGNITTEGKGETQLLVQTGPNVREPSNRRAQILPRVGTGPTS